MGILSSHLSSTTPILHAVPPNASTDDILIGQAAEAIHTFRTAIERKEETGDQQMAGIVKDIQGMASSFQLCLLPGIEMGHIPATRIPGGYCIDPPPGAPGQMFISDSSELYLVTPRSLTKSLIYHDDRFFDHDVTDYVMYAFVLLIGAIFGAIAAGITSVFTLSLGVICAIGAIPLIIAIARPLIPDIAHLFRFRFPRLFYQIKPLSALTKDLTLLQKIGVPLVQFAKIVRHAQSQVNNTLDRLTKYNSLSIADYAQPDRGRLTESERQERVKEIARRRNHSSLYGPK